MGRKGGGGGGTGCSTHRCMNPKARAGERFADIEKALDERTIGHNPERLNLMKGGIVYSNRVTTVSPTYAEEARSGGAAGYLRALINEPRVAKKVCCPSELFALDRSR